MLGGGDPIVLSTATPTDPPICMAVLATAAAPPASRRVDAAGDDVDRRGEDASHPGADQYLLAGRISAEIAAARVERDSRASPAAASRRRASSGSAGVRAAGSGRR